MVKGGIKINFDGFQDFNKALKLYRKVTSKTPAETINAKLFFFARNATNTTKTADKGKIRNDLLAPAKSYPTVPLVAILKNKQLGKQGKKGLNGEKMATAVEKFINVAISHTNFLRSGWLPAINILAQAVKHGDISFTMRRAPKQAKGLKQLGNKKGNAIYAKDKSIKCYGEIANYIGAGKQASPTVQPILLKGLQDAVTLEVRSMVKYLEDKYNQINKRCFKRNYQ